MPKRQSRAKRAKTTIDPAARPAVDQQRDNSGQRDDKGRFAPGNALGFQPGQSGNPAGRKPGRKLSEAYGDLLSQPMPANLKDAIAAAIEHGAPVADILAMIMVSHAAKGKVDAVVEMRKATEGNTIKSEVTGKDGRPLFPNPNAIDLSQLSAEELEQFTANVQAALAGAGATEATDT